MTTKKAAKTEKKAKEPRVTIAGIVMKAIHDDKLYDGHGKEAGLKVIKAVKEAFPKSKFSLTHYFWYVSRYRRQESRKLGVDHLYVVKGPRLDKHGLVKGAKKAVKAKQHASKATKGAN